MVWESLEDNLKKKYQVFISSTYIDLTAERQAAVQAILTHGNIPAGMELFAASNQSQWEVIKNWIEDSDIYMLILGARYGSVEPVSGKSYTQLEYEYAMELNKPSFSVVIDEGQIANLPNKFVESENPEKLKTFRKLLTDTTLVEFFKDTKDIEKGVLKSLRYIEINSEERLVGWVRADKSQENTSLKINQREPRLALKLNNGHSINIKSENPTDIDLVRYEPILEIPKHLEGILKQEEVDKYNERISRIDYSKYRNLKILMHNYKVNALPLDIELLNKGTLCAGKIRATLEFPDFVLVEENKKINSLITERESELAQISSVENPLELAAKKYERSLSIESHFGSVFKKALVYSNLYESHGNIAKIVAAQRALSDVSGYRNIDMPTFAKRHNLDGNKIFINFNELMHEDAVTISDYSLIPLNAGEGVIKITLHCQEYLHSESFELGIKVS